jgi:hypothetical protein
MKAEIASLIEYAEELHRNGFFEIYRSRQAYTGHLMLWAMKKSVLQQLLREETIVEIGSHLGIEMLTKRQQQ